MPSTGQQKVLDVRDPDSFTCQGIPFLDEVSTFAKQILWKSESQEKFTGKLITFYLHEKSQEKVAKVHKSKEEEKPK